MQENVINEITVLDVIPQSIDESEDGEDITLLERAKVCLMYDWSMPVLFSMNEGFSSFMCNVWMYIVFVRRMLFNTT